MLLTVVCLLGAGLAPLRAQQPADEGEDVFLPPGTTLPVQITHTLRAGRLASGDLVDAVLMQEVEVNGTSVLLQGTHVLGRVVEARGLSAQGPSVLSIRFFGIRTRGRTVLVSLGLRALADTIPVRDASLPAGPAGAYTLVGGAVFQGDDPKVRRQDSSVVGYHLGRAVYAHLQAGAGEGLQCQASRDEESLAIFSPSACGLYGFENVTLLPAAPGVTLKLSSSAHEMRLYAGGAALLQVEP